MAPFFPDTVYMSASYRFQDIAVYETSGRSKLTKRPHRPNMDGSIVFVRWRQCAPHLMPPWAHLSPHPKRHLDRFSRFCRAHNRDRQTDRQTDHAAPSVTEGRIYVRSTAMRTKNKGVCDLFEYGVFAPQS